MPKSKPLKPKKKCCKDDPRCKRCPVVLKRLENAGLAKRDEAGRFELADGLRKKDLKAARSRKG